MARDSWGRWRCVDVPLTDNLLSGGLSRGYIDSGRGGGAWRGYRYVSCLRPVKRPVLARVHQLISVSHRRVVPASCVFA